MQKKNEHLTRATLKDSWERHSAVRTYLFRDESQQSTHPTNVCTVRYVPWRSQCCSLLLCCWTLFTAQEYRATTERAGGQGLEREKREQRTMRSAGA